MKNADLPAMPMFSHEAKPCEIRDVDTGKTGFAAGLTKREDFAKTFIAAQISTGNTYQGFIDDAIMWAEEALAKLDETKL